MLPFDDLRPTQVYLAILRPDRLELTVWTMEVDAVHIEHALVDVKDSSTAGASHPADLDHLSLVTSSPRESVVGPHGQ